MKSFGKFVYYGAVLLVLLSLLTEEVEARRKILRGRKTITRTYYRGTAIPAWSIAVLVGIALLIVGGGIYFVMRKIIFRDKNDSAV